MSSVSSETRSPNSEAQSNAGDTEPNVSPVVINIGGEGEIPGAINVNGEWIAEPGWRSAREGEPTLTELEAQGHVFILLPEMDKLPFADASVDISTQTMYVLTL